MTDEVPQEEGPLELARQQDFPPEVLEQIEALFAEKFPGYKVVFAGDETDPSEGVKAKIAEIEKMHRDKLNDRRCLDCDVQMEIEWKPGDELPEGWQTFSLGDTITGLQCPACYEKEQELGPGAHSMHMTDVGGQVHINMGPSNSEYFDRAKEIYETLKQGMTDDEIVLLAEGRCGFCRKQLPGWTEESGPPKTAEGWLTSTFEDDDGERHVSGFCCPECAVTQDLDMRDEEDEEEETEE